MRLRRRVEGWWWRPEDHYDYPSRQDLVGGGG